MKQTIAQELLDFIYQSPTAYHVVENVRNELREKGYIPLSEKEQWNIQAGKKYYVTRNDSAIIAFRVPEITFSQQKGFRIISSHSDSPCFKIKPNPEISIEKQYVILNTEKYGGMIYSSWLDRPLSIAGRIMVLLPSGQIESRLIRFEEDMLLIPNLAIHMNRNINDGYVYNPQTDLLPLLSGKIDEKKFATLISEAGHITDKEKLLSMDMYVVNHQKGSLWGPSKEFVSSPRLDDLQCVFCSLKGFLASDTDSVSMDFTPVYAVFDNEEVGSSSKQGADSDFLKSVITRFVEGQKGSQSDMYCQLAQSFMISADNAHAVHPNHQGNADVTNRPYINGGMVLKFNGNQKYTTDSYSEAVFRKLCDKSNLPVQTFCNRSDIAGGSTLGNISTTQVSIPTVDMGLPQLSMHSAFETAGTSDTNDFITLAKLFYSEQYLG